MLLLSISPTDNVVAQAHTEVSDIYDTAINPQQPDDMPDDIYDEAMPQPVSLCVVDCVGQSTCSVLLTVC